MNPAATKAFDLYARLFARRGLFKFHKALFYLAARGLGLYNLSSMRLSGEGWILDHLARKQETTTIFDVGANEGGFVRLALASSPRTAVHAFEPHPETFARLARSLQDAPRVRANPRALGDVDGEALLHDLEGTSGTGLASLHRGAVEVAGRRSQSTPVKVNTLDTYCGQNGIDRIDLLKIDTEGHELAVLRGARGTIARDAIGHVQFEFNEMNVASRSFLADFRRELPGYRFYRLLVDGPASIEPYAPFLTELFGYQNILAVHPAAAW